MADFLVGRIRGHENAEVSDAARSIEAFAPVITAANPPQHPQVARDTSAALGTYARFLGAQAKYLKDGHAVRVVAKSRQRPRGPSVRS
jgi:hypothetical protein